MKFDRMYKALERAVVYIVDGFKPSGNFEPSGQKAPLTPEPKELSDLIQMYKCKEIPPSKFRNGIML